MFLVKNYRSTASSLNGLSRILGRHPIRFESDDSAGPPSAPGPASGHRVGKKSKNVKKQVVPPPEKKPPSTKMQLRETLEKMGQVEGPVVIPRPGRARSPMPDKSPQPLPKDVKKYAEAIRRVAESFGGDVKQTETDLVDSVRKIDQTLNVVTAEDMSHKQKVKRKSEPQPRHATTQSTEVKQKMDDLLKDISIDKSKANEEKVWSRFSFGKFSKLDIFTRKEQTDESPEVRLELWDKLETLNLDLMTKQAPRNYYEELITWTNEGKLWHFPIDNEQGLDDEANTHFTQHVFLEDQLEPWCPKRGPLRNFMNLVLIGLSKNPYITVRQKHEHIKWFQTYFEGKRKLLTEIAAYGEEGEGQSKEASS